MRYPAKFWAKLCAKVEQYLPVRFSEVLAGQRPHPWQVQAQYYKAPKSNEAYWRATLTPGCVNAIPAYVTMELGDAPAPAQERIRLDNLAKKKPVAKKEDRVRVFLDEEGAVKLAFRKIGSNADPTAITGSAGSGKIIGTFEKVPDFFKRLGVADAKTDLLAEKAETQRLLLACDLVLNQPRVGLTNQATMSAITIDTSLVSIDPGFFVPPDRDPAVVASPKFSSTTVTPSLADLLFQRFVDFPFDQFHLSTVFLLSPPLPLLDPADISSWQPYIRYNCHHNLVFVTKQIERRAEFVPITLVVPLAGGIAQPLINYLLAEANFFAQAALDFFQQKNLGGKFYAI